MVDLKKNIKARGYTISALADALHISQPSLSMALGGNPSLSRLQEIADAMNIKLSELLAEDESDTAIICPHCGKPINIIINKD